VASEGQIEANRRNARLGSGPRGSKGKARVTANALKHGLTAKRTVLPNEDPDEFETFRNALCDDLDPQSAIEELLVQKIVADAWRILRAIKLERAMHARDKVVRRAEELGDELSRYTALTNNEGPAKFDDREKYEKARTKLHQVNLELDQPALNVTRVMEEYADGLDRLWRHEETLSRSFFRTLHELQRFQAIRWGERVAAPAAVDLDLTMRQENAESPEAVLQNKAK